MQSKTLQHVPAFLAYGIVIGGALIMLTPFYFMFVFATHESGDIMRVPPPLWFGDSLMANIHLLLEKLPNFPRNIGMSFYVSILSTVLNLLFCSMAGYAFSMFQFRYKETLFAIVMATMLLPAFLGMIPTVLIMSTLGWMDQPRALYIPGACGAMGVFMMRQYIGSAIPKELIEAVRIDGCSEVGIYWRIVVPLVTPAFGTLGLVTFIGAWNNFMGPLVVMQKMENFTVPLALRALQGTGQVPWGAITAGSAIAVLPLLVLFVLASRRLIDGLTAGAVKA